MLLQTKMSLAIDLLCTEELPINNEVLLNSKSFASGTFGKLYYTTCGTKVTKTIDTKDAVFDEAANR